jgi:repressor LexA
MGRRIRELRLEKGLSQEELGRIVGVKRAAVNKWETGQVKNLRRDTIETLSRFFDVSPSYLMGMTDIRRPDSVRVRRVPILGSVAAGNPILALEEHHDYIEVDGNIRVDFCLRVRGDSMIDARICDGDLVFIRSQPVVDNGDIAVVLIDDEATLKRFYRTDGGVILKPENSKYQPMYYTDEDFKNIQILGKAVLFQSKL